MIWRFYVRVQFNIIGIEIIIYIWIFIKYMVNGSQKNGEYYGESTDPCRTPCFIGCWTDDIELLILMLKLLSNKKFLNHKRGISFSSIFCNLSIIVLNSSVSNAEDNSSSISCWDLLLASKVCKLSKLQVDSFQFYVLVGNPFVYYQVSYI